MVSLNDKFRRLIKEGYYKDTKHPRIVKFMEYGSKSCAAAIFDTNGRLIDANVQLMIDSENERERYDEIPYDQLPEPIKVIMEIAQTQPSCTGLDEDLHPFPYPEKKGGPFDPDSLKKY